MLNEYVCVDYKGNEIPFVVWADEQSKQICVADIKNNIPQRNKFGMVKTKVMNNVNFKILHANDYAEIDMNSYDIICI
jgi:hypothetical protein